MQRPLAGLISVLLLSGSALNAAGPGATSANFLKIPVGARQAATGASFTAVADDPTAAYYNPAGLAQIDRAQALFSHNRYFEDITQQWFGAALPFGRSTLAFSLNYLSVPPFPSYSATDTRTGSVSAYDMAAAVSYAGRRELDNDSFAAILYGFTARHITQQLDSESARGYGADAGIILKPHGAGISLAAAMSNLYASKIKFIDEGFTQPRTLKLGAAYRRPLASGRDTVLSLSWDFPDDGSGYLSAGVERPFTSLFTLRAGYSSFGEAAQGFSLGFGLALPYLSDAAVDYSFSNTWDLGGIHRLSLLYKFGSSTRTWPKRRPGPEAEKLTEPREIAAAVYREVLRSAKLTEKLAVIRELSSAKWEKSGPLLLPLLDSPVPELRAAAADAINRAASAEKDSAVREEMRAALAGAAKGEGE